MKHLIDFVVIAVCLAAVVAFAAAVMGGGS
jgi:hypothetical protein